jgi:hypothetical protein
MSSYGEQRDRRDEINRGDFAAMQRGYQSTGVSGRSKPVNKRKNALSCCAFLIFLLIAVLAVVLINVL